MLATLSRELPEGDFLYEPKWDGFRCLAFVRGGEVDLRSRNQRALARYFPEITSALEQLPARDAVLDGELVIIRDTVFDFPALLNRVHPAASRIARLSRETPALFIAFDLLSLEGEDLRSRPFSDRRAALARLLEGTSPTLRLTPSTEDPRVARDWLDRFQGGGIDGVVAKARTLTYQPGRRAMIKVKHEHTVETVVAGFRMQADRPVLGSLLLGMYDGEVLRHVGVSSTFTERRRRELLEELGPYVIPLAEHPWREGFGIEANPIGRLSGSAGRWDPTTMNFDWYPLPPVRVCEVAYDQVDALRFRHPAKFVRWRPDRDPRSCTIDQLTPVS